MWINFFGKNFKKIDQSGHTALMLIQYVIITIKFEGKIDIFTLVLFTK